MPRLPASSVPVASLCLAAMAAPAPSDALEVQDLYTKMAGSCWACDALEQAGSVGLDVAEQIFDVLSGELSILVGLLMAVWTITLAGRIFLPFGPDGASGRLWNQGARRLLAFALILGFLQSSQIFWDYLFMPIVSLGTGLSVQLSAQTSSQSCEESVVGPGVAGAKASLQSLRCPLSSIQDVFTKGMLTGVAMTLGATWRSWMDLIKIWTWPGQILQILSGMLLALVYAFGFMMYPAFFADAILRGVIIAVMAPLAAAASTLAATRRIALKALWGLAQAALTMVFASVAAGLASQSVNAVYATLTSADGTALSDWPTLIGALEAGTVHLSIVDQAYWAILALGVITIFMIRGAARMAAALTDLPPDEFSGATAGIATLAAAGARMTVGAAQRVGLGGPMTPLVPRVTRLIGNQGASLAGKVGRRKDRRGRAKRGASASKDAG